MILREVEGMPTNEVATALGITVTTVRVQISRAFRLNLVRIGQMGEQCRSHNLFKTLYALGMSFQREGVKLDVAHGMAALEEGLAGGALRERRAGHAGAFAPAHGRSSSSSRPSM